MEGVLVRLPSPSMRRCRRFPNFAHVSMVYSGHLPIVPGDCNGIPTRFGDNATIGGIAPPINASVLLEGLGFVDCHCCTDAAACIHALPRIAVLVTGLCERLTVPSRAFSIGQTRGRQTGQVWSQWSQAPRRGRYGPSRMR